MPVVRPGSVSRTPLVNRLRAAGSRPVVTVLAPAGYGKTTVLAQWAERDGRPFVWVSIDEDDDDPVSLARRVASGLSERPARRPGIAPTPGSPSRSAAQALRRLTAAVASAPDPFVLVLDNIHLLRSRRCVQMVAALAEHVPDGSTLVLAGRSLPRLPIARMRAAGRLFEVGVDRARAEPPRDQSHDAQPRRRARGERDVAELADRTEGWAAGAYLAALSLKDGGARAGRLRCVRGDDRFVVDYFDFEHLSRLSPSDVGFLTRTAVLDRMSGPLCDAVLGSTGSASKLESIATANLFVVPLDRQRGWYRYHHEFRDFLLAELERREPELVPELHRRAAAWCESNGAPRPRSPTPTLPARPNSWRGWSPGSRSRCAPAVGPRRSTSGSTGSTIDGRLEQHPTVAAVGAWVHLLRGRPAAAKRWIEHRRARHARRGLARRRARRSSRGSACSVRRCAETASSRCELMPRSRFATWVHRAGGARRRFSCSGSRSCCSGRAIAARRALTMLQRLPRAPVRRTFGSSLSPSGRCSPPPAGTTAEAEALVAQARALVDEVGCGEHPLSAIALRRICAPVRLRTGDLVRARADLASARALRLAAHARASVVRGPDEPRGRHAPIWPCSTHRARDAALSDAAEILRRVPRLGSLGHSGGSVAPRGDPCRGAVRSDQRRLLTTAELRLLPLLTTHLSFREIGERLCVSRSTVKTQAISVYRKLVVSSRSEAIARAVELGLVERRRVATEFNPSG